MLRVWPPGFPAPLTTMALGRGVGAHRGGCARQGLLPRVGAARRGGRVSIGSRVPCTLPRVRALRVALTWRGSFFVLVFAYVVYAVFLDAVAFVEVTVPLLYLPSPSSRMVRWCSSWARRCRTNYIPHVGSVH